MPGQKERCVVTSGRNVRRSGFADMSRVFIYIAKSTLLLPCSTTVSDLEVTPISVFVP